MSGPRIDADAFRGFEREAHSRIADSYNDRFAAITDRAIVPLLDAAKAGTGTRLLDVACGPGRLTRAAAERGTAATGCDLAPAMVALARKRNPAISFDEASAEALPYPDGVFDAVVYAFGMGHFLRTRVRGRRVRARLDARRHSGAVVVGRLRAQPHQRRFP